MRNTTTTLPSNPSQLHHLWLPDFVPHPRTPRCSCAGAPSRKPLPLNASQKTCGIPHDSRRGRSVSYSCRRGRPRGNSAKPGKRKRRPFPGPPILVVRLAGAPGQLPKKRRPSCKTQPCSAPLRTVLSFRMPERKREGGGQLRRDLYPWRNQP